jgi:hypothetical protein
MSNDDRAARRCQPAAIASYQRWHAFCDLDGRGVQALAGARIGQRVELAYSRVDADGTLCEARVAAAL